MCAWTAAGAASDGRWCRPCSRRRPGCKKHVMIGGIDAQNVTSIALHEKLGFKVVGELQEVAFKFGRWLDLKFMQRLI